MGTSAWPALYLACLSLASSTTAASESDTPPKDSDTLDSAIDYVTYPVRVVGRGKITAQIGDYAKTTDRRFKWKHKQTEYNDSTDMQTSWAIDSFAVVTTGGATARAQARVGHVEAVEYRPPLTFASLLGWEDDKAHYKLVKVIVQATIQSSSEPEPTWRLEAERFGPSPGARYYTPGLWGDGTLSNGVRLLDLTYRNTPPYDEETCAKSEDRRIDRACYQSRVTEVSENGEWLASYAAFSEQYVFRTELDENLKLLILAALEAFRLAPGDIPLRTW